MARTGLATLDSNDPFTLSITLPLDKAEHKKVQADLNKLRSKIAAAKQTHATVQASPTAQASMVMSWRRWLRCVRLVC